MQDNRTAYQRGQMLPMIAGGIVCLMLSAALAVDVGYWRYQQRLAQSAADSAAVAGGISLNYDYKADWGKATVAANTASSANGFTDGVNTVQVKVQTPSPNTPVRPNGQATAYPKDQAIEVDISKTGTEFFSSVLGVQGFAKIGARAVAASLPDLSACMYQLDYQGGVNATGVDITGNKDLNLVNCGLIANGPVNVPGYGTGVTGVDYWPPSQCSAGTSACAGPSAAPNAQPMAAPANDPCQRVAGCAYIANTWNPPPPDSGTALNGQTNYQCTYTDPNTLATATYNICPQPGAFLTDPSTGKQIGYAVIHNATCCQSGVSFAPGVYFIWGGMTIKQGSSGNGITLVNVNGTLNYDGSGAQHPTMIAPNYGPTQGVVFYQPSSNANTITLNGGGNGGGCNASPPDNCWEGLFYAPSADLTSNGGANDFAVLVVGDMRGNGGGSGSGYCEAPSGVKCDITVYPALAGLSAIPYSSPTKVVLTE